LSNLEAELDGLRRDPLQGIRHPASRATRVFRRGGRCITSEALMPGAFGAFN
jgi:hypothetical protein